MSLPDHLLQFGGAARFMRATLGSPLVGELEDLPLREDEIFGDALPIDKGSRLGRDLENPSELLPDPRYRSTVDRQIHAGDLL
jgi:hypothetical protein